jgi:ATP-dependent DNA helicase RecG
MLDYNSILANGESDTVEFKSSFGKAVIEAVCAFANHRGGMVLVGISDVGRVVGVSCSEESVQTWVNEITQNTAPSIIPNVEIVELGNRTVVCIRVDEFPVKPVAFRDRYYKRVVNSNHRMSLTGIANMHIQSLQLSWDAYPAGQVGIESLSCEKIEVFLERVRQGGRFGEDGDPWAILEKLGYLKKGAPTHAAMLLFGVTDPPYSLHIGRFKTPSTIIDDRMVQGCLFVVVEDAMKFITSHLKVAFEITGDIQRREIFEYPQSALRELLLNAVVYRDYTSPTDIQIKIFDNAITFFNPGKLYGGLTVEQLKTDSYQSCTRNKLIAEAFYLIRDIEKYGSGYIRVRKEILAYPTMRFQYEECGDGYVAKLSYSEQRIETTPKTAPKTRDRLLKLIQEDEHMTREALAFQLGISVNGVKQHIQKPKKEGVLKRIGDNRTGYWKIV